MKTLATQSRDLSNMFFNKQMQLDPTMSGRIAVGDANTLGQIAQQSMRMPDDGFFYVYTTTLSARSYYFDKLTIKRWKPQVRVKYDYYPYGMLWENPDLQDEENRLHDHAYQDKEFMFGEYDGTVGLALYDFHARMFDPATRRWLVPDPAAQFANPYLAMGNNPVSMIDPTGTTAWDDIVEAKRIAMLEENFMASGGTETIMMEDLSEESDPKKGSNSGLGKPKYSHLVVSYAKKPPVGFSPRTISSFSELSYPSPTSNIDGIWDAVNSPSFDNTSYYPRFGYSEFNTQTLDKSWSNEVKIGLNVNVSSSAFGFNVESTEAGFEPNVHWIGPTLIGLGSQTIMKPFSLGGTATKGTSIASTVLRIALPYRSPAIKNFTTRTLGRSMSTAVLGGAAARFVPIVGWIWAGIDGTIYFSTNEKYLNFMMKTEFNGLPTIGPKY